ncbi:helix-turn-helix psq, partial [Colletotrichum incanum]
FYTFSLYNNFPLRTTISSSLYKSRIILTLKAIKKDLKLSVRKAFSIYNVPFLTLNYRRVRRTLRHKTGTNSIKITLIEESIILK